MYSTSPKNPVPSIEDIGVLEMLINDGLFIRTFLLKKIILHKSESQGERERMREKERGAERGRGVEGVGE